jgi:hypothetical protein
MALIQTVIIDCEAEFHMANLILVVHRVCAQNTSTVLVSHVVRPMHFLSLILKYLGNGGKNLMGGRCCLSTHISNFLR